MGKIKGWKKLDDITWENINNKSLVGLVSWGTRDNTILWSPRYSKTGKGRGIAIKRGGFLKEDALYIAKNYMRANPNGVKD